MKFTEFAQFYQRAQQLFLEFPTKVCFIWSVRPCWSQNTTSWFLIIYCLISCLDAIYSYICPWWSSHSSQNYQWRWRMLSIIILIITSPIYFSQMHVCLFTYCFRSHLHDFSLVLLDLRVWNTRAPQREAHWWVKQHFAKSMLLLLKCVC